MDVIVDKVGGSSGSTAQGLAVFDEVRAEDPRRRVWVYSAPGARFDTDPKVTRMLIDFNQAPSAEKRIAIMERIKENFPTLDGEFFSQRERALTETLAAGNTAAATLDASKAWGEQTQAMGEAQAKNLTYWEAADLFVVKGEFGHGIIEEESRQRIRQKFGELGEKEVAILGGFYGKNKEGQTITFDFGGSDTSAAYVAAALNALKFEMFSDQPGVLAADPRIIDNPKILDEITYREARDLSAHGLGIFQSQALEPVATERVMTHVRYAANPKAQGTLVVTERISDPTHPVIGVSYEPGYALFSLEGFGLDHEPGLSITSQEYF